MTRKIANTSGHLPKWIYVFICLLCLIATLIVPTATSIAFEEHEHEYMVICRVTGIPEYDCAVERYPLTSSAEDHSGLSTYNDLYNHKEVVSNCQICVLTHKSLFQNRLSCSVNNSVFISDIFLSSQDITGVEYLHGTLLTPVDLKNKLSN